MHVGEKTMANLVYIFYLKKYTIKCKDINKIK